MFKKFLLTALFAFVCIGADAQYFTMDMVHHNPGDTLTRTKFLDPNFLKSYGYDAKTFFLTDAPQVGLTWETFDPTIFPVGSVKRKWVDDKDKSLQAMYNEAKAAGIKVYCAMDMLVLPTDLFNKYRDSIASKDNGGNYRIDITKPATKKLFRYMLGEIFKKYPQVDGLVIRTGEIYTQNAPYHKGNNPAYDNKFDNHAILVNILRDEVCVKRDKKVIYRTWDDGRFHSKPSIYLQVTNQVDPHPNLFFSIKHTNVDFWRMGITDPKLNLNNFSQYFIPQSNDYGVYFNPCLGIGKHKQFVEVQCQREYEGKATHPNYIAKGVLDGFPELNKPDLPKLNSLNELKKGPLLAGVWTWSRGGGWGGPRLPNEFWADMNAYVVSHWAHNPARAEADIFKDFAILKGLPANEVEKLHQIALMSDTGVIKGQWSMLGTASVAWTRDQDFSGTATGLSWLGGQVDKWAKRGTTEAYIKEKVEAFLLWKRIEALSKELHFKDPKLTHFVQVSCTYGRLKYQTFMYGWSVMVRGYAATKGGPPVDQKQMGIDIAGYDQSVADWKKLVANNPDCGSMYNTAEFEKTVSLYRAAAIPTDAVLSFSITNTGKTTKVEWTTAFNVHNQIDIEHSTDGSTWEKAGTVPGNTAANPTSSFSITVPTPAIGEHYYRLKLVDGTSKTVTSQILKYTVVPHVVLESGGAVIDGKRVKLTLVTAEERFNDSIRVIRSTDGINWNALMSVPGAGTKFTPTPYLSYDDNPVEGRNYYAVQYYDNGKLRSSKNIWVEISNINTLQENASAFNIYPNPATTSICFKLTGYKGRTLTATLTTLYGKTVSREILYVNAEGRYTLHHSPISGTYVLNIWGEKLAKSGKVFVQ
ncbi:hypothetical protein [Mucilaginibacter limnophilus]|uniref:hypothetical protein n=1 Tax=Mucilaginibacter limnophilus TaxID=1932778 RepID=UPI00197C0FBE|nr:hypothetical protein [Mucilaginibacter limnophilus]